MNKVGDNKLSSIKTFFCNELIPVLGERECQLYFEACCDFWLGMQKMDLAMDKDKALSESEILKFLYAIKDFKKSKPLAHVIGEVFFYGLNFKVSDQVLVPRPETEELVDLIVNENPSAKTILDVGTGSGCIPICVKNNLPSAKVIGVDISAEALKVAKENAVFNDVEVLFYEENALKMNENIGGIEKWDVMVSNPPYIPLQEKESMDRNVVDYDPGLALFVPNDEPLLFYDAISTYATQHLNTGGKLYFEIHEQFGEEVCEMMREKGFSKVRMHQDMQGKDRMVVGQF